MRGILPRQIELSPRRWMFLPMEYKVREFDGTAMLAFEAAERHWGVVLGKKAIRSSAKLPRGMLIEKWVAPGMWKKLEASRAMGRKISAWCEEGLVYSNAEEYGQRKLERRTYDSLEMFFAWGRNQAEDMVNKLGYNGDKLFITGNPRFDLHRPDLRAIIATKSEKIRQKYGRFILINTRFSQCNGFFSINDTAEKRRKLGLDQTAGRLKESLAFQQGMFAKFMELVGEISYRFRDNIIVIRPHPSERLEPWQNKASKLSNVEVVREGNVAEWILASEVCIQQNCTTGVEAYCLGKTSIAYRPIRDSRFDLFLPNALSAEAYDLKQVVDLVRTALSGCNVVSDNGGPVRAEIARRFIANVEGKRACERILDALDSVDIPEEPLTFSASPFQDFGFAIRCLLKTNILNRGEVAARKRHSSHKLDGLNEHELLQLLKIAREVTGRFADLQVTELEREVLCVY
jgi:surface carbohydrate biosynthesis protein